MIFQWQAQQSLPFVFSDLIRSFSLGLLVRSVLSPVFLRSVFCLAPSSRPSFSVRSFVSLRPLVPLFSFGLLARPVLSLVFLRSASWPAPSCRTSFIVRPHGSLRPVFEFLVFLLTACRSVPRSRHNMCFWGIRGRVPMVWTGRRGVVFADRWAAVGFGCWVLLASWEWLG